MTPTEIWQTQLEVGREALASCGVSADDVAAIGITNQRETTVLWDRVTGQPIHHAIVWQDRRTSDDCDALRDAGHTDLIQRKTGLVLDPYFCATKIHWLLKNVPGARERADRGELAFGTIDSWLIWNLTGGRAHVTDVTNASRTLLLNLSTGQWDEELLQLFDIPRSILPEVRPSSHVYGDTLHRNLFGRLCPDRRRRRRPASRVVRAELHPPRHGKKHVRHGLLHADARRLHP